MKRFLRGSDLRANPQREVSDELRFHMEMRTQEFIDAGMTPDDARRAAQRAFGDVTSIEAALRVSRATRARTRDRRDRLHDFLMDAGFALRTLQKNAGFTLATLATLVLGIGATTAVFTVVNGVLLRPLPYGDPSRLEMLWLQSKKTSLGSELPVSSGLFLDARGYSTSFTRLAAFRSWSYALTSNGDAEQIAGVRTTPALFSVLGVPPLLGRTIVESDVAPGAAPVVLLGYDLWQRRFGENPGVVGQRVELGGESFTIVGVMPSGFAFPRGAELPQGLQFAARTELWTPLVFQPKDARDFGTLNLAVIGRLKNTVRPEQARRELSAGLQRFLKANAPKLDLDYQLLDLQQQAGSHVRRGLLMLMGAVILVLFIACANVTNLLLARTTAREREFAVRAALGAGRARIARQLVTENVILAAAGGAIGVAVAAWATRALLVLVPGSLPRADDVRLDWRVAAIAGAAAIALGIVFGLASTFHVEWRRLAETLRDSGARATGGRQRAAGRRVLVVAEVAVSLMLLIGASLLTLSFVRLQRVRPGFSPEGALTASVALPLANGFNPQRDGPEWARFFAQLTDAVSRAPGVRSAGAVSALPLTGTAEGGAFEIMGEPKAEAGQAPHTEYFVVQGDYFQTLQISLLAGRNFSTGDRAETPLVAIINRAFAKKFFPAGSALDHQIICHFDFSKGALRTIVGIVDDVASASLDATPLPQVYVPEQQMPYPALNIVVRADGDPLRALPALKSQVRALDPRMALAAVRTMDAVVDESLARRRFSMTLVAAFAGSALVLAVVGLYGVIALSVSQRRREISVRMALGAQARDVLRLVLGEGMHIAVVGTVIGILGALALSRLVASLLFGVSATSAAVYAASAMLIVLVTIAATLIPARRAARGDAVGALRE